MRRPPGGRPSTAPQFRKADGGPVTPERALATTLALLEAKKQRAKQPPPYPNPDTHQHMPREEVVSEGDETSAGDDEK